MNATEVARLYKKQKPTSYNVELLLDTEVAGELGGERIELCQESLPEFVVLCDLFFSCGV